MSYTLYMEARYCACFGTMMPRLNMAFPEFCSFRIVLASSGQSCLGRQPERRWSSWELQVDRGSRRVALPIRDSCLYIRLSCGPGDPVQEIVSITLMTLLHVAEASSRCRLELPSMEKTTATKFAGRQMSNGNAAIPCPESAACSCRERPQIFLFGVPRSLNR